MLGAAVESNRTTKFDPSLFEFVEHVKFTYKQSCDLWADKGKND